MMPDPITLPLFDELRTERLIIRPYALADVDQVFAAVNESRDHLRPWLPFADQHQAREDTHAFIARSMAKWITREDGNLGMFRSDDGVFLGGIGMHPRHWEIRSFEIGYWLRTSAAGQGYVRQAVRRLTSYLLDDLGAQRVMIRCDEHNERSANVARRLGFVQEGRLRNDAPGPDGPRTTLIFARIPGDPPMPEV